MRDEKFLKQSSFILEHMDKRFKDAIKQMPKKDYVKLYKRIVGEDDLIDWYKKQEIGNKA